MVRFLAAQVMGIVRAASLLAFIAIVASPATEVRAGDGPQLNVIEVNTVNYPSIKVTFEVNGSNGVPLTGLDRNAFAVYENGLQQQVVSGFALESSPTPLTVMLAIDTSLSMADRGKLQATKDAATAFVDQMRPIDRVGLIQFDSQLSLIAPFTSDRGTLTKQINGLTPQGNTRIYDAIYLALMETSNVEGMKAVVLMTDGQDTESAIDLPKALSLIRKSGIRIYAIGIGNDIDVTTLTQIATQSGGHYYSAPTAGDIGRAFQLMSNQLRSRYEIDYSSPATAAIGSKIALGLTAQTVEGLASAQTSYVTPVFSRPSQPGGSVAMQTPPAVEPSSTSVMGLRAAYASGGLAALGVLLGAAGIAYSQRQRARYSRLAFFVGGSGAPGAEQGQSLFGAIIADMERVFAGFITHLLPPKQVQRISRQLTLAGNPFGWRVSQFVVVKCLLALGAGTVAALFTLHTGSLGRGLIMTIGLGFLGYRLPTFWLKRRIETRQNAILKTLPDALDLLTICVEAGLGLDGAMLEVVKRWDNALSDEFATVLAELQMGRSRRDALRGLADRTGLQEVTTFTSAMVQADELGMGIARPLALQAQQLRIKRKQRAEKLAHEAGIKMVVAMGIFIMPALFMIILSPAVVQIQSMFGAH